MRKKVVPDGFNPLAKVMLPPPPNEFHTFWVDIAVALRKTWMPLSGRAFEVPKYTARPLGPFGVLNSASKVKEIDE